MLKQRFDLAPDLADLQAVAIAHIPDPPVSDEAMHEFMRQYMTWHPTGYNPAEHFDDKPYRRWLADHLPEYGTMLRREAEAWAAAQKEERLRNV